MGIISGMRSSVSFIFIFELHADGRRIMFVPGLKVGKLNNIKARLLQTVTGLLEVRFSVDFILIILLQLPPSLLRMNSHNQNLYLRLFFLQMLLYRLL